LECRINDKRPGSQGVTSNTFFTVWLDHVLIYVIDFLYCVVSHTLIYVID